MAAAVPQGGRVAQNAYQFQNSPAVGDHTLLLLHDGVLETWLFQSSSVRTADAASCLVYDTPTNSRHLHGSTILHLCVIYQALPLPDPFLAFGVASSHCLIAEVVVQAIFKRGLGRLFSLDLAHSGLVFDLGAGDTLVQRYCCLFTVRMNSSMDQVVCARLDADRFGCITTFSAPYAARALAAARARAAAHGPPGQIDDAIQNASALLPDLPPMSASADAGQWTVLVELSEAKVGPLLDDLRARLFMKPGDRFDRVEVLWSNSCVTMLQIHSSRKRFEQSLRSQWNKVDNRDRIKQQYGVHTKAALGGDQLWEVVRAAILTCVSGYCNCTATEHFF